jgi:SCY1-like protein 1
MCSGFSDSSAALRELTLKSTAALVPHLTQPNLEKLCRYLVRLQQDQETSIRTNTVIFFSKIAPYLTETTRQKMLLPAFVRAMKDPFTPCRLAALKSTLKAKEFFNPSGVATRVMPAVTPLLVDPSAEVRREAFMAVEDLLFVLRQESERLNKLPEPQQQQHAMNGAAASASHVRSASAGGTSAAPVKTEVAPKSGSGFSLGGLSSWMTSKATAPDAPAAAAAASHAPPQRAAAAPPPPPTPFVPPPAAAMSAMNLNANNANNIDDWGDDDDGLDDGDGWDDDLDLSGNGGARAVTSSAPAVRIGGPAPAALKSSPLFSAAADEDDFFGTFDAKPAKPVVMRKMGGATTGKLVVPSSKSGKVAVKPAVKKLSASEDVADGWDDF